MFFLTQKMYFGCHQIKIMFGNNTFLNVKLLTGIQFDQNQKNGNEAHGEHPREVNNVTT